MTQNGDIIRRCTCDVFSFVQGRSIIWVLGPFYLLIVVWLYVPTNSFLKLEIEMAYASFLAVGRRHVWQSAIFCAEVLALFSTLSH